MINFQLGNTKWNTTKWPHVYHVCLLTYIYFRYLAVTDTKISDAKKTYAKKLMQNLALYIIFHDPSDTRPNVHKVFEKAWIVVISCNVHNVYRFWWSDTTSWSDVRSEDNMTRTFPCNPLGKNDFEFGDSIEKVISLTLGISFGAENQAEDQLRWRKNFLRRKIKM